MACLHWLYFLLSNYSCCMPPLNTQIPLFFQPTNGLLLYLELLDFDSISDDLIDKYAIEIPPLSNALKMTRSEFIGVFEVATLDVSISVTCQPGFTGQVCNVNIVWATVAPILLIVIIGLIIAALLVFYIILVKCKKITSSPNHPATLVSLHYVASYVANRGHA